MHQPFISIIITVLNGAKTLSQCLSSVSQQTFTDYELVIVDGGSQDATLQIINESTVSNRKVQVLPGAGLYKGLNAGVKLSVGKWLYFIGADDELYSRDTLQKVYESIKSKRDDTKVIVGKVACVKQELLLEPKLGSIYMMRHQVHHQGMFYDRAIFNDLLYNEDMRIASDYEFNLRLALIGIPHQLIDIIVCNFGGDGVSENQFKKGYAEMQQVHKRLLNGIGRVWAINYFWLRRNTGLILRRYNFAETRLVLKKLFG